MAANVKKQDQKAKRGWLLSLVIGIAAILMLSLGFAAGMLYDHMTKPAIANPLSIVIYSIPHEDLHPQANTKASPPIYRISYFEFDEPFTVNLRQSTRMVQAKVALSTSYDDLVFAGVRQHQLALRAATAEIFANCLEADLRGVEAKLKIQDQIKDVINKILVSKGRYPGIESAFITSLTVQ